MTETTDPEEVQDWAEKNFKAMKERLENLRDEMRNSKPERKINVRRVDSDNLEGQDEDQIVVEHTVQRWYSINYFKKMLEHDSESSQSTGSSDSSEEGVIL